MRLAIGCLLLAACGSTDPCSDITGACVSARVEGGATGLDQLAITIDKPTIARRTTAPSSPPLELPVKFFIALPAGVTGSVDVAVEGLAMGNVIARDEKRVTLDDRGHASATFRLDASSADLNVADTLPPDFAIPTGADYAMLTDLLVAPDLVAPMDLATPSDLSSPADQSGPPDLVTFPDLIPPPDLAPPPCSGIVVSTLAGNGGQGYMDGTGGPNGTAQFQTPSGVAVDANGNVFVGDTFNHRIRRVSSTGMTTTFAGNGTNGFQDGSGGPTGTAWFSYPRGLAIDSSSYVYVADTGNHRIRSLAPGSGNTATISGNGMAGFSDGSGGPGGTTKFNNPWAVAVDNLGHAFISDWMNYRVRKTLIPSGSTVTLTGNGIYGLFDGSGGAGGTTEFESPFGIGVDGAGNVYLADADNNCRIRKIAANGTTTTFSGNGTTCAVVDGTGGVTGTAEFGYPIGVAVDGLGNVYVTDSNFIRRVGSDGATVTIAGTGIAGFKDGDACSAVFNGAGGIAVLGKQLFVADAQNNRIRMLQLP